MEKFKSSECYPESTYIPGLFGENIYSFRVTFYNNHIWYSPYQNKGHLVSSLIYKAIVQMFVQFPSGFESGKNNM